MERIDRRLPYYYEIGKEVLVFWEDEWRRGKITNGYRTHEGVINTQLEDGTNVWFGEKRHEEYLKEIK